MSYQQDRKRKRRLPAFAILVFAFLLCGWETAPAAAQQPKHGPSASATLSTRLTISMDNGKKMVLSSGELAALPHKTVAIFNDHRNVKESYSGVPLSTLLGEIGVPQGDQVKGALFMIHVGDVLVADTLDGHNLGAEGAFKLVSTEDRRPARWVRNLTAISVIHVKPPM